MPASRGRGGAAPPPQAPRSRSSRLLVRPGGCRADADPGKSDPHAGRSRPADAEFAGSLQSRAVPSRGRAAAREPLGSPGFFVGIGLLYVFSIPWWFRAGEPAFVFGMPTWALASLGCTLAISGLTAFLALRRWDDDPETEEGHSAPPGRTGREPAATAGTADPVAAAADRRDRDLAGSP